MTTDPVYRPVTFRRRRHGAKIHQTRADLGSVLARLLGGWQVPTWCQTTFRFGPALNTEYDFFERGQHTDQADWCIRCHSNRELP